MHFFNSVIVCASALAAFAAADLAFTSAPTGAQAGHTYKITWSGETAGQPVSLILRKGSSNALTTVSTITSSASGGSFEWTVPTNLQPEGDYALQILQGTSTNYWDVGAIAGGSATASASASASSVASSASSSASSVLSSASSRVSSLAWSLSSKLSSETATTSSVSAGTTHSSRNSTTIAKATLTSTKTSSNRASSSGSSASSTESSGSSANSAAAAPSQSGEASNLKSNAALVLGAIAAMAYLG